VTRQRVKGSNAGGAGRALQLDVALGHLVRRAQQVHNAMWAAQVSTSVTSVQFGVLTALAAHEPLDQASLGQRMGLDRATAHGVVRRLHAAGYVDVQRSTSDGRRHELRLTPQGAQLHRELLPEVERLQRHLADRLPPGDDDQLIRLLHAFVEGQ
jgi:DNA-binding MarR family transcriptional regulator